MSSGSRADVKKVNKIKGHPFLAGNLNFIVYVLCAEAFALINEGT